VAQLSGSNAWVTTKRDVCGALMLRHDIFFMNIPTSGTASARRTGLVSSESRLSQAVFFSDDCLPNLGINISYFFGNSCVANGLRAL
jgi:hypothetical protein